MSAMANIQTVNQILYTAPNYRFIATAKLYVSAQSRANSNRAYSPLPATKRYLLRSARCKHLTRNRAIKLCGILLLSMITGLPVKSLLIPGYIGHPNIFKIKGKKYYIEHSLVLLKDRQAKHCEKDYENILIPSKFHYHHSL